MELSKVRKYSYIFTFLTLISAGLLNISCESTLESDSESPDISILSPASGATVTGNVKIECQTDDNTGIRKIEFYADDKLIGENGKKPFAYTWNTIGLNNGAHKIKTRATDLNNNTSVSAVITVYVDNSTLAPDPLNILSINYTKTQMTIIWERSLDSNFSSYNLYYSDSEDGAKTAIIKKSGRLDTTHVLTSFNPAVKRWYWIETQNSYGYSSFGEPYPVLDLPPSAIAINSISFANNALTVKWNRSEAQDFDSYVVYQYSISDTNDYKVLKTIKSANETTAIFSDTDIGASQYKYYKVGVKDYWSLEAKSVPVLGSTYPNKILYQKSDVLYVSNSLGGDSYKLTDNNAGASTSQLFSPDGGTVYFLAPSDFGNNEIFSIGIDGTNEDQLSSFSIRDNEALSINEDGSYLVYVQNGLVGIMNSQGGNQRVLTTFGSTSAYPIFSPVSNKIVYLSKTNSEDYYDLMTMDENGENKLQLTKTDNIIKEPISISPGGSLIACVVQNTSSKQIYLVASNGSSRSALVSNIPLSSTDIAPKFSPDGTKLLYESNGVYLVNVSGGNPVKISDGRDPHFTPDGSKVIFISGNLPSSNIYIYDLDEKYTIKVSGTSSEYSDPLFQP